MSHHLENMYPLGKALTAIFLKLKFDKPTFSDKFAAIAAAIANLFSIVYIPIAFSSE